MSIGKHGAPGRPHLRTLLNANPVNCCPQHNPNQTEPTLPNHPPFIQRRHIGDLGFGISCSLWVPLFHAAYSANMKIGLKFKQDFHIKSTNTPLNRT